VEQNKPLEYYLTTTEQMLLSPSPSHSPVPNTNLYAQLNGLQLCLDPASLLWVNLFSRGLLRTLEQVKAFYQLQDGSKAEEHVDIRMDAAQIKVRLNE
jgi:hypothetical protein